jgi:molybdenum cofactor cytidylyltransferase
LKFGPVPVSEAQGTLLAHSVKRADLVLRKGHRLDATAIARLAAAGVTSVVVARLGPDDVHEDEAAQRMAQALAGTEVDCGAATTGRTNLYARRAGLVRIDAGRIHAINAVHESLTVATLPDYEPVGEGQMLATVKIIPYATPRDVLESALGRAQGAEGAIRVAPYRGLGVGLILTRLPQTRAAVLAKMRSAVEKRLAPLSAQLIAETEVAHEAAAIAAALSALAVRPGIDAVLISGIAATVDRADVVPAGIERAGGVIVHAGMPVDPGNLLLLAQLPRADSRCVVVGIPTCARSPKLNGFDFVLRRLAAGLEVGAWDIMHMGVGGLLGEIPTRPMPREAR